MRPSIASGVVSPLILVGLLIAGCGRLRFEALPSPVEGPDSGVDASPEAGPFGPCDATVVEPALPVCPAGDTCPLLVRSVAASASHTCAIDLEGRLWCWGTNCNGQLGQGDRLTRLSPVEVALPGPVGDVDVGPRFTCAVTEAGALYCWGRNDRGTLGLGDRSERLAPTEPVLGDRTWQSLNTGGDHACAIDSLGELWCWGSNMEGQLAQPDPYSEPTPDRLEPIRVSDARWREVTAEEGHTCGIREDGTVWCTGRHIRGQLGAGEDEPGQSRGFLQAGTFADWAALDASAEGTCGIREDGTLWCWGHDFSGSLGFGEAGVLWEPTQRTDGRTWRAVSINRFHGCGVQGDGTLWCWGRDAEGQLGFFSEELLHDPVQPPGFTATARTVSVSTFISFVITEDAALYATGHNEGRIGTGDTERPYEFTQIALP